MEKIAKTFGLSIIGLFSSLGVPIYTLIEQMTPIIQILSLIIGLAIGITTLFVLTRRFEKVSQDIKINERILRHPEIDEEHLKQRRKELNDDL